MKREAISTIFQKYVPMSAVDDCVDLIVKYHVAITITRERMTKQGDYRAPHAGHHHRISVNHNLNQYAFLITFIHEIAHLVTFNQHRHKTEAHGAEWKQNFRHLLIPFLHSNIFPDDIKLALVSYIANPAAATCNDLHLYETLLRYDKPSDYVFLKDIAHGAFFILKGYKDVFIRGELLRKNFMCRLLNSQREYKITPLAQVLQVDAQQEKVREVIVEKMETILTLNQIPIGSKFKIKNDKDIFIKHEKLRTFFRCSLVSTGKVYRIRGAIAIESVEGS